MANDLCINITGVGIFAIVEGKAIRPDKYINITSRDLDTLKAVRVAHLKHVEEMDQWLEVAKKQIEGKEDGE